MRELGLDVKTWPELRSPGLRSSWVWKVNEDKIWMVPGDPVWAVEHPKMHLARKGNAGGSGRGSRKVGEGKRGADNRT